MLNDAIRSSLRKKLMASYLVLILFRMVIFAVLTTSYAEKRIRENSENAYTTALQQAAQGICAAMEAIEHATDMAQKQANFIAGLRQAARLKQNSEGVYDCYQILENTREALQREKGVAQVLLALDSDAPFVGAYLPMFPLDAWENKEELFSGEGIPYHWFPAEELREVEAIERNLSDSPSRMHVLLRQIVDTANARRVLGYFLVFVEEDYLLNSLMRFSLPEDGGIVLRAGDTVLYARNNLPAGANEWDSREESFWLDGKRYIQLRCEIAPVGWELILFVSQSVLYEDGHVLREMLIIAALCLSAAALAFAMLLTRGVNKRLNALLDGIHHIEQGAFGYTMDVEGNDEYAQLAQAYNKMSIRVKALVENLRSSHEREKDAQMRLLYEHLNPHFIYNTLDIIHWAALRHNAPEMAALSDSLTRYLRKNLNHGRTIIRMEDELQGIESYMQIMNYRYRDSVAFTIQATEEARQAETIKLLLQPLVENALLHGVMCRPDKTGFIRVYATREKEELILVVEDNGVGMEQEEASQLLTMQEGHFGLRNVFYRIRTYYGMAGNMQIVTQPGKGFSVSISMPYTRFQG